MEQQKRSASTSSQVLDTQQQPRSSPHRESRALTVTPPFTSGSVTSQPSPPTPSAQTGQPLSTSEPSLRFPRPFGNSNLANWISSSDPDIMRVITTPSDEAGLAESTFELIPAREDDVLSQDENDHDLISESVSSLDAQRADDVHSLTGEEHMSDDDDYSQVNETLDHTVPSEMEDSFIENAASNDELINPTEHGAVDSDPEVDTQSISSLEYTQQSLKAPSMVNSELVDLSTPLHQECHCTLENGDKETQVVSADPIRVLARRLTKWLPGSFTDDDIEKMLRMSQPYLIGVILLLTLKYLTAIITGGPAYMVHDATVPAIATTTKAELTPSLISPSTLSTTTLRTVPTPFVGGVSLIPRDQTPSQKGIFAAKKPEMSFTLFSDTVLIEVPENVMDSWNSRNCITVMATRDQVPVEVTTSLGKDGVLSQFPRSETYGVVNLAFETSCKPSLNLAVNVPFGPGILGGVYGRTKNIAQDIGELVPAAAQGAIDDARRSWKSMSSSLTTTALSVREKACNSLIVFTNWSDIQLGVGKTTNQALQAASERLGEVGDASKRLGISLKLNVLDAQISAKTWWLRVTRDEEEWTSYQTRAKDFMTDKRNAAARLKGQVSGQDDSSCTGWYSIFKQGIPLSRCRCQPDNHRRER